MRAVRRLAIVAGVLIATLFWPGTGAAQGNAVTVWNTIATAAVLVNPGRILDSRTMAAVHAAIDDAVNAIDRRYRPYLRDDRARVGRSMRQ
jgi:hypothetical protein